MIDISTVSNIVAALGVLVGVTLTVQELRDLHKQRKTELLVRLAPWLNIDSLELQEAYVKVLNLKFKDYDDFVKKYGSPLAEKPEQMALMTIGNYFEAVGALRRRKLLDVELMWDYWGETFITFWEKIMPYAEGFKKEYNQQMDNAEYLYNEMKKVQASKTA